MTLRVALIAGEASGDQLGADLMRAIKAQHPDVSFEAVAGPKMRAEGCREIGHIDELSVMGISEVVKHLPRLLRLRRDLVQYLIEDEPDVVIGIDAPDFNLGLEKRVRKAGIPTVHYVSPTVWAWRAGRVNTVAEAADLLLCLFPFEPDCYRGTGLKALFAGNPLAADIEGPMDQAVARKTLSLPVDGEVVAMLPGSRSGEVSRLGPLFLKTARALRAKRPDLSFVVPMAGEKAEAAFASLPEWRRMDFPVHMVRGKARESMAAADVVLAASGTATMEAMLLERPTVVSYQVSPLTHALVRGLKLIKTPWVAMPNVLAGQAMFPEHLQSEATPAKLAGSVDALLADPGRRTVMSQQCRDLADSLRAAGPATAARAILELAATRHSAQTPAS
ncbi:lipid-A-disaccharide synthase [Natronospira proteinivora]|uniref:Lipid-A-disaccharide synthase n=1 Tax=Natronospira proteinivora TaxID=1807133 RepID=A0ABT1G5R0_9GAMM|nr:lipid-A-disaccharide synthase [Natronospira proteinivora]MCP1726630.1 lipid-A-disaccharide synthase [Natronospira proteinivora]